MCVCEEVIGSDRSNLWCVAKLKPRKLGNFVLFLKTKKNNDDKRNIFMKKKRKKRKKAENSPWLGSKLSKVIVNS